MRTYRWLRSLHKLARPMAEGLLRFGLPNHCGLCGKAADRLLCKPCARSHIKAEHRCQSCGHKLLENYMEHCAEHCGACLSEPPRFDRTHVALDYHAPWDSAIHALKFGHRLPYAQLLAEAWSQQFSVTALKQIDCLMPAPLSAQRLRERGFNQSLEIARHLAKRYGLKIDTHNLVKVRDTPPQVGLSHKERLRNVRGAFSCLRNLDGQHIAIVDDVMTSGATLAEIAATLKHAGAKSVTNVVMARTPKFD